MKKLAAANEILLQQLGNNQHGGTISQDSLTSYSTTSIGFKSNGEEQKTTEGEGRDRNHQMHGASTVIKQK